MADDYLSYFSPPIENLCSDLKEFRFKTQSTLGLADYIFENIDAALYLESSFARKEKNWPERVYAAQQTLKQWFDSSGRVQNYTSEELAQAQFIKETANKIMKDHSLKLTFSDAVHSAIIRTQLRRQRLEERLIAEGKEGRKFALVELSARLSPALTFEGASNYLSAVVIPYGKEARTAIGELHDPSIPLVSAPAALASAHNAHKQFGAHYVLAETSAAPRNDVPKSGRKPEIYVCRSLLKQDGRSEHVITHHTIDTPFREKFDSTVREIMYEELKKLYEKRT